MKSARHQLILLGLLCQGMTWNGFLLPGLYGLAWLGCLVLPPKAIVAGSAIEGSLLVGGGGLAWYLGQQFGVNTHFFLGHGLALVQLARLLRPLNRREAWLSLLIAVFHLAVVCTFLFDYRFIPVWFAAVFLLPRALQETTWEFASFPAKAPSPAKENRRTPEPPSALTPPSSGITRGIRPPRLNPGIMSYGLMVAVMLLFFLFFPRLYLGSGFPLPMMRGAGDPSLLDSVMDLTGGGGGTSRRIVFQVHGEDLGYLRCHALTEFDGQRWTEDPRKWATSHWQFPIPEQAGIPRRVRVKDVRILGEAIPVDGLVTDLHSSFFRYPRRTVHGTIESKVIWNGAGNVYEYAIHPAPPPETLSPARVAQYTRHPVPSAALRDWITGQLRGLSDPWQQAKYLQQFLKSNFVYELGAPRLSRLNPTDDFIFRQKRGHCERFASTLALLLRLQGIPSRVVVGYLPTQRNWITGDYDIRLSDAHAWTEGWFTDKGWVILDATPAGTMPQPSAWYDWLDAMDFAWYSYVVNYDIPAQKATQEEILAVATALLAWIGRHAVLVLGLLAAALLGLWLRRLPWLHLRQIRRAGIHQKDQLRVEHFYHQLLNLLAKQGLTRHPAQTPLEFLATIQQNAPALASAAGKITRCFCEVYYGDRRLTREVQRELRRLLADRPGRGETKNAAN